MRPRGPTYGSAEFDFIRDCVSRGMRRVDIAAALGTTRDGIRRVLYRLGLVRQRYTIDPRRRKTG